MVEFSSDSLLFFFTPLYLQSMYKRENTTKAYTQSKQTQLLIIW